MAEPASGSGPEARTYTGAGPPQADGPAARRRRRPEFSPFTRFLVMRVLLLPGQVVFVLVLLYVFGTVLPAIGAGKTPGDLVGAASNCAWSSLPCSAGPIFEGLRRFVYNLFTGNWGFATFFSVREPAIQFVVWWLPNSVELAVVALALSALLAYPIGLRAGWRPGGVVDSGARALSSIGLLVPSFLVIFILIAASYEGFLHYVNDTPYGTLPGPLWLDAYGTPPWIGIAANTSPTGFPILDALLHRDLPFAVNVLARTLVQALTITVVYVGIFFRYARHAVVEATQERFLVAARARGLTEHTLLWRHAARRVLPVYLLLFGATLPAYVVTQALAEAIFNYTGLGTLLISEFSNVGLSGFGFGSGPFANFYQVAIFLLAIVVLVGTFSADVLAHYLDPRQLARVP